MLVLGNEGGGPRHIQGHHTRGLYIGLRKLVGLTLNIHQISIIAILFTKVAEVGPQSTKGVGT